MYKSDGVCLGFIEKLLLVLPLNTVLVWSSWHTYAVNTGFRLLVQSFFQDQFRVSNGRTFFVYKKGSKNDWETIDGKRKCPVKLNTLMNDKISVKQEAKLEDAILCSQFLDVDSVND